MIGRRRVISGLAGMALAAAGGWQAAATAVRRPDGLASRAGAKGLLYGASISEEALADADYARLYREEAAIVTTDVAMKFDWIRPEQATFAWERADALATFAEANNLLFRGHTLIWNDNAPRWLKGKSPRELESIMDQHIDAVVGRYRGRMHSWDVVNEPFWPDHGVRGGYRRGPWFDGLGPAYIARAFRRAAAADPGAKLVLNEAFTEHGDRLGLAVRAGLLALVDSLQQQGVPLHAVGFQAHLDSRKEPDNERFALYLREFEKRGLDIYITELDVIDVAMPDDPAERDAAVARRYAEFLDAVLSVPAVKMVITWQMSDRYSWLRDAAVRRSLASQRAPRPLPFDEQMRRKPAWLAMARAFDARRA